MYRLNLKYLCVWKMGGWNQQMDKCFALSVLERIPTPDLIKEEKDESRPPQAQLHHPLAPKEACSGTFKP